MKYIITLLCICTFFVQNTYATDCGSQGVNIIYLNNDTNLPSGSSNNGGNTAPPDQGYVDPVSNHKHAVGLHYVKYKMPGQKNWHKGTVDVELGTNQKIDIRVKVKEKNDLTTLFLHASFIYYIDRNRLLSTK